MVTWWATVTPAMLKLRIKSSPPMPSPLPSSGWPKGSVTTSASMTMRKLPLSGASGRAKLIWLVAMRYCLPPRLVRSNEMSSGVP